MGNKGIIISGSGQLNSRQVVVGDGAHIVNYGEQDRGLLLERIENLLLQIRNADLPANQFKSLSEAASAVKEEAKASQPDKTFIENSLSFIEKTAPSITAVTAAVKAVMELVSAWVVA